MNAGWQGSDSKRPNDSLLNADLVIHNRVLCVHLAKLDDSRIP